MRDSYYNDSVNKLDWSQAQDFSRPWVKLLKPHIEDYLNKLAVALGYQSSIIDEFWFQQYVAGQHERNAFRVFWRAGCLHGGCGRLQCRQRFSLSYLLS